MAPRRGAAVWGRVPARFYPEDDTPDALKNARDARLWLGRDTVWAFNFAENYANRAVAERGSLPASWCAA